MLDHHWAIHQLDLQEFWTLLQTFVQNKLWAITINANTTKDERRTLILCNFLSGNMIRDSSGRLYLNIAPTLIKMQRRIKVHIWFYLRLRFNLPSNKDRHSEMKRKDFYDLSAFYLEFKVICVLCTLVVVMTSLEAS